MTNASDPLTMTPQRAHKVYALRCKMARAQCAVASREYAERMSAACREYEANMRMAASQGDTEAARVASESEGPYLNT